ncbi:MAG: DUF4292 domain-containing protein [Balneolales bacterium]|nr:DUF4292 domain-containing protein [Balneolales bacterium]
MKHVLFIVVLMVALAGCTPRPVTIEQDNNFTSSNRNPQEILDLVTSNRPLINSLSGRARAQFSTPGSSERSTVQYGSDRDRSLLTFRNSLGIEAGRLLVETDSVTLFNRIDQVVQKVGSQNQDILLDNGYYAVNMLNVLNPDLTQLRPRRVSENATSWRITFDDNTQMVFDKETYVLTSVQYYVQSPIAFSTYLFANHTDVNGYPLPRNVQILSNDKKSSIFLTMQSYEVNPPGLNLDLEIPSHIRVIN